MKIYIVNKNVDFTEGRGPMLFHKAFKTGQAAIDYVSKQQGIFGSNQYINYNQYGYYAYANGYNVMEVELES